MEAAIQGKPQRQENQQYMFYKQKAESVCPKLEILFWRQTYQMMWKNSSPRPCVGQAGNRGAPFTISPESPSPHPSDRSCFYCHDSDDSGPLALCWGPMRPFPLNPAPWDQALVSLQVQGDNCRQGANNCTLRGCPALSHGAAQSLLLDSNKTRPPGTASQRLANNKAPP